MPHTKVAQTLFPEPTMVIVVFAYNSVSCFTSFFARYCLLALADNTLPQAYRFGGKKPHPIDFVYFRQQPIAFDYCLDIQLSGP